MMQAVFLIRAKNLAPHQARQRRRAQPQRRPPKKLPPRHHQARISLKTFQNCIIHPSTFHLINPHRDIARQHRDGHLRPSGVLGGV